MPLVGIIPYNLSLSSDESGLYTLGGVAYHYAVGGLPFLSAASNEHPIVRATAQFRKQQFDASDEPGEQSLDGWWIRSQQSFHGGAGQLFADPDASDAAWSPNRFYRSKGVDCWSPGQVSLLKAVDSISATGVASITSDGVRAVGILDTDDLFFVDEVGAYTTDNLPAVMGLPAVAVSLDGSRYYMATSTEIFARDIADPPLSPWTPIYFTFESGPADPADHVVLGWAKERLVLATERGIYELTDFDGPQDFLPAPRWTPPQGEWTPTAISESNSAIYVAGTLSGQRAVILKFTLDDTGAMPELTSGTVVANLPQGETITSLFGYLGRFLAIGTSVGPRIAEIDSNGDLTVGPTLFEGEVGNWSARGQYLYASAVMPEWESGEGGLVRIDLGLQHDELRFAYASDLYTTAAGVGAVGVGLIEAGLLVACTDGLFLESADEYVDSGWLQGSRIRYSTLEPKIYKLLRARGSILTSDYYVSVIDPDGQEYPVVGYVEGQTPGADDVSIPTLGPLDYLSVKITLYSTDDHLTSAVAGGYQVKALPGQPRQRIISIPLLCYDFENDGNVTVGGLGTALERLMELEELDTAADVVMFQDFGANTVESVAIDSVEFVQTFPPAGTSADPNWGGIITLTLRTV